MRGIPCALGCSAYLSVWREVGALCVERLAVFVSYIQSLFPRFVQNFFPVSQDSFSVQLWVWAIPFNRRTPPPIEGISKNLAPQDKEDQSADT